MTKVLELINFYSLEEIKRYIDQGGAYPLHHIWGYDQIREAGYPVGCVEYNKESRINKLGKFIRIGNLQQQLNCIRQAKDYDLIFAPFMNDTLFLAFLKTIKLYRKPMLVIAQHAYAPYSQSRLKRWKERMMRFFFFNGIDRILFLNENIFKRSAAFSPLAKKHDFIRSWGVDFDFFNEYITQQQSPPANDYIFSTGGTNRDFNTLIEAFNHLDFKLKITAKEDFRNDIQVNISSNVEIDTSVTPGLTSVARLRSDYYNSLAVAIPILVEDDHNPAGVTVLFEAAALGKPVITTWNKSYPFDVEKEKIGFNINYGDSEGWRQAIKYMTEHREEVYEMGKRAHHLCRAKYNYKLFSGEVIQNIALFSERHKQ